MKSRKWMAGFFVIYLLCVLMFPAKASAQVSYTEEPTGEADTIYVAGNPDLFPIESYNDEKGEYEGIVPEVLKIISEKTGINFTYVSAGSENRQVQLAKNKQVEMLTAYTDTLQADKALSDKVTVMTVTIDGRPVEIRLAFTEIASKQLISSVKAALHEIPEHQLTDIAVRYAMDTGNGKEKDQYMMILILLLAVLMVVILIQVIVLRRKSRKDKADFFTDSVTGIGNKKYLEQKYALNISENTRSLYYVVYIAFDFNHAEEYMGEKETENILVYAANILTQNISDTDFAVRLDEGNFVTVFQSKNAEDAKNRIVQIVEKLNCYQELYNKKDKVVFHAGVYDLAEEDWTCETAVFNARQAYQNAAETQTACSFSNMKLRSRRKEEKLIKMQTSEAIEKGEFMPYIQFMVDRSGKKICGGEMLARWQHPTEGLLMPARFVDIMSRNGSIIQLDYYMFEKACQCLQRWREKGKTELFLTWNATRTTLSEKNFLERLREIAGKYEFDHARLVVEITENELEENKDNSLRNINGCREMGFKIAIDDLGSGYSSFMNLCEYPTDYIKIDREIMVKSIVQERGMVLLGGIIEIAHRMGILVICEGVEEEHDAKVKEAGCDFIQGWKYYHALPQIEADKVLNAQ